MAKPEWGTKRSCLSCGARFYDLQRESVVCPACGAAFDPAVPSKPRRVRAAPKVPVAAVATAAPTVDDPTPAKATSAKKAAAVGDDDETENDGQSAIEDVSELGDDDVADVIEIEDEDEDAER